jgi:hypothetical protein
LRINQVPKPEHKAPAAPSTAIRGYVDGSLNHAFRRLYVLSAVYTLHIFVWYITACVGKWRQT